MKCCDEMKNKSHTVRTNLKSNIIIITLHFTNFILCPDFIDIYPYYSCQKIYCNNMSLYYFSVTISKYFWLKHGGNSTNVITQHNVIHNNIKQKNEKLV